VRCSTRNEIARKYFLIGSELQESTKQTSLQGDRMMRPRELFGVGVRVLAVWYWTQSAYWAYFAFIKWLDIGLGNPKIASREDVAYAILNGLTGVVLMAGARALAWLAYGDAPKADAAPSN
jgi:hypothetical protein